MFPFAKFILGLALVGALVACTAGNPTTATGSPAVVTGSTISLSLANAGQTIKVPVGSEVDITLQTVGPGQYANPQVSSTAVRFLGMSLVTPVVPAGPTQLFRFEATAPGQSVITIQGPANNPAFEVTLQTS